MSAFFFLVFTGNTVSFFLPGLAPSNHCEADPVGHPGSSLISRTRRTRANRSLHPFYSGEPKIHGGGSASISGGAPALGRAQKALGVSVFALSSAELAYFIAGTSRLQWYDECILQLRFCFGCAFLSRHQEAGRSCAFSVLMCNCVLGWPVQNLTEYSKRVRSQARSYPPTI